MPQRTAFIALHTDYSEEFCPDTDLPEDRCGEIAVKRLVEGDRGHYGPLEHSHLSLLIQADHNTMMQLRTHRVGLSFDLQSQRYTGIRFEKVATGELSVERVFHFRSAGKYRDRQGDPYDWTDDMIQEARDFTIKACELYRRQRKYGVSEEQARGIIPTNYLQNGMITGNIRSWFHLLDVRSKLDAQLEARWTMDLVQEKVAAWVPELYAWYEKTRLGKARLAP